MNNFDEEINKIKIFIPSFLEGLSTVRAMIRVYLREHNISKLDEIQLLSVEMCIRDRKIGFTCSCCTDK